MTPTHTQLQPFTITTATAIVTLLSGCALNPFASTNQNPKSNHSQQVSIDLVTQPQTERLDPQTIADPDDDVADPDAETQAAILLLLESSDAGQDQWRSAAEWLLGRPDDPDARKAIFNAIEHDAQPGPRAAMLAAIADRSTVPESFLPRLERLLDKTPPTARSPVLAAIGSVRSQRAAALLLESTPTTAEPAAREAAFRALTRMTGNQQLGWSAQAWQDWHDQNKQLSTREWSMMIVRGLADRADRLESEDTQHTDQLLDLYDRLIELTPDANRSTLLAEMLLAPQSQVRAAAVRRGSLEHALGRTPGRPVEDAIIKLLDSDDPWARKDAASLALAIGAEATAEAVVNAVIEEQTPEVVEVLLRAAARWPRPELVDPVLTWLASGDRTRTAAAEAATALAEASLLTPAAQAWIGALLRRADIEDLAQIELSLLVSVGEPGDLRRVADALSDQSNPARLAAAEALVLRPEGVDPLIAAATDDPTIVPLAADAIFRHRQTQAGLEALLALHAAADTTSTTRRLARELPLQQLIQTATDPARTDTEVTRLLDDLPARETQPAEAALYRQGLEALALSHLALDEPAQALIAIESLPISPDGIAPEELALRTRTLIRLNRLEDAQRANAPLEVWQQALNEIIGEPHEQATRTIMASIFSLPMQTQPTEQAPQQTTDELTQTQPTNEEQAGGPQTPDPE